MLIQASFSDDVIRTPSKVVCPALPGAQEWNPTSLKGRQGRPMNQEQAAAG
jgi:hypothetical protein